MLHLVSTVTKGRAVDYTYALINVSGAIAPGKA